MSIRPVPSQRMDRTPQVVGWRAAESRRAAQQSGRPRRRSSGKALAMKGKMFVNQGAVVSAELNIAAL